jgi:hypothetical protein
MLHKYILYVPGKNPKPQPDQHRVQIWRTLLEGVRRIDVGVAADIRQSRDFFYLVGWNFLYYRQYVDISGDIPWIDRVIKQQQANVLDLRQAGNWKTRLSGYLYNLVDHFPAAIPFLPAEIRNTLQEIDAYFLNRDNIGTQVREMLKQQLRPLLKQQASILVIGHSLGSVIAYDTFWQLTHEEQVEGELDFLTLGSPLGVRYVQQRLKGSMLKGAERYPHLIRHWFNIAAVGDLTAIDRGLHDDFSEMLDLNLLQTLTDNTRTFTYFRNQDGLNVHRSYGYFVTTEVGQVIADWWQGILDG